MRLRRPRSDAAAATRSSALTMPSNQVAFVTNSRAAQAPAGTTPRAMPAPPEELSVPLDQLRAELRFTSALPVSHWIRCADRLKRQADQEHMAGDVEAQYVALFQCWRLLATLLPQEHTSWAHLDDHTRAGVERNARAIASLLELTRDTLRDARGETPHEPAAPRSPAARQPQPRRSSLRTQPLNTEASPKRVSFAGEAPAHGAGRRVLAWLGDGSRARRAATMDSENRARGGEPPHAEGPPRGDGPSPGAAPPETPRPPLPASLRAGTALSRPRSLYVEPQTLTSPSAGTEHSRARALERRMSMSALNDAPESLHRVARDASQERVALARRPIVSITGAAVRSHESPLPVPPKPETTLRAAQQHMSLHQQQQGFVPATGTRPRPPLPVPPAPPASAALAGRAAARWGELPEAARAKLPLPEAPDIARLGLHVLATAPATPATTEAGAPLRTLVLPADLMRTFLALAQGNTARGIETCGLLLGREDGALRVTHLVLPPQSGSGHSCAAGGEEQILALQLAHGLLTLGWIHTHPTQTCFLSSLDLHTHAGYQALLPEAVAVVCAPRFSPNVGVFRLTQPPGLQYVLRCASPEPFHAHVDGIGGLPLYTDALPGHVAIAMAPLCVHDLRV